MARRKRFESAATSRAFRGPGQGLQASRGEIEKKTRADVENIKAAKFQAKEAANLLIGGTADAAKFEEGVQKVKNDLEQKIRTRKYEALSKRAETDVDRLLGEAKEKEKYAKHLAQLAPKAAKAAGDLAGGMFKMHKHLEAQGLIRDRDKKGLFNPFDESQDDVRTSTYESWLKDRNKVDSTENWNTYFHSVAGKDSQAAANLVKKELLANKNEILNWARELAKQRKWRMSKGDVIGILESTGLSHLNHVGIDPGSRGGREILRIYEQVGILEQQRLINVDKVDMTSKNMSQTIDAVGAELISPYANRDAMEQVQLNTLVTHVLKGVHDDGKGGFITYSNLANAGEEAVGAYLKKEFSRFQTRADAEAFIDKFVLVDPDNPDAKSEGFGLRHPDRKERLLDIWQKGVDGKTADNATDVKAKDLEYRSGFDTRLKEHLKNQKDNPTEYTTSTEQFYLNEVEQATRQVGGSKDSKNYIYEKASISLEARTEPQKWIAIRQLQLDGKYEEAAAIFSGYSTAVREKLAPQFKFLDSIKEGGFTYTVGKTTYNGAAAIRAEAQAIHLQSETSDGFGSKNIHGTGTKSVDIMVGRVVTAYNKNIDDGMSPEKARINAWEQEKLEYKKGINQEDNNLYPKEDSAYSRRLGSYEHIEKGTMPQWIYKNQQPTSDAENLARIIEYRNTSEDGSLAKATADLKNLKLEKMPVESVYLLTKHGYITEEHFLTDPRFVPPKKITELGTVAINIAKNKTFLDDAQLSAVMPENIKVYAALTNQTPVAVANKLLEDWNGADKQVRFQAGGQDASILSNDGEWVSKNNVPGMNVFQACRAQNCTPMRESVQIWKNLLVPSTNREFTTADGTTVTLPDDGFPSAGPMQLDPKLEAFGQSIGITYDGVTLSNPEVFWEKGGANYLNWDQLNSMFGLQNIENYKEVTKEISEKWKTK